MKRFSLLAIVTLSSVGMQYASEYHTSFAAPSQYQKGQEVELKDDGKPNAFNTQQRKKLGVQHN